MRGWDERSDALFSYVSCEVRVTKDHPLRPIRRIVDEALAALPSEFEKLYARFGRPSMPPERLLRALLLLGICRDTAKPGKSGKTRFDWRLRQLKQE